MIVFNNDEIKNLYSDFNDLDIETRVVFSEDTCFICGGIGHLEKNGLAIHCSSCDGTGLAGGFKRKKVPIPPEVFVTHEETL